MLELRNVWAGYGTVTILKSVSVTVDNGECVAILGPNGAGKTTLLKTISGFLPIQSGEVFFKGNRLDGRKPPDIVRMGITHVLEGRQIFTSLTVAENLWLGAHLRLGQEAKSKILEDLEAVYQMFPILRERGSVKASSLSGGEQQMLAIGRALMSRPKVLLLDEPSMGLGPKVVKLIGDVLHQLRVAGMTILLVEQNADMALELANRIYVLVTGNIVLEGQPAQLRGNQVLAEAYLGTALPANNNKL